MSKHNQDGAINGLLISFIFCLILLIGAVVFAVWAYQGRQDYKNNVDAKISAAVAAARSDEDNKLNAQFAEASKQPLKTYNGPESYGSIVLDYPKTWSGYVDDSGNGSAAVDGYFAPGVVPSITAQSSVFALRLEVVNQTYASVLQQFSGQQQQGQLTVSAYALPKLPKVVGVEISGTLNDQQNGTMIVLPLRTSTLELWTDGTQYLNDFNNYILPNFSFSP